MPTKVDRDSQIPAYNRINDVVTYQFAEPIAMGIDIRFFIEVTRDDDTGEIKRFAGVAFRDGNIDFEMPLDVAALYWGINSPDRWAFREFIYNYTIQGNDFLLDYPADEHGYGVGRNNIAAFISLKDVVKTNGWKEIECKIEIDG